MMQLLASVDASALGAVIIITSVLFLTAYLFTAATKTASSPPALHDTSGARRQRSPSRKSLSRFPRSRNPSSYRIDEENGRKSSSEITRRGVLWSRHASWHLPAANRHPRTGNAAIHETEGLEHVAAILDKYDVDLKRGFLPSQDPLQRLPYARYHIWEDLGDDLSKLLGARLGQAREPLRSLPVLKTDKLVTEAELRRAHLLLCLFAHAYIWGGPEPLDELPEGIAKPLCEVSSKLDIPPVLGHPSIVLYNWRKLDNEGSICMENLATLNNFFDGRDESWFYLITVEVEARGAGAVVPMMMAIDAIQRWREEKEIEEQEAASNRSRSELFRNKNTTSSESGEVGMSLDSSDDLTSPDASRSRRYLLGTGTGDNTSECSRESDYDRALVGELDVDIVAEYVAYQLERIAEATEGMCESMEAMQEGCHPFIFYHRVRPFLSAWKDNPILPEGVIYKGVSEKRMQFYGGSAAQSALIPFLDIGLGISHASSKSHDFLQAMRDYMIRPHREFLAYLETVACVRNFVTTNLEERGILLNTADPQRDGQQQGPDVRKNGNPHIPEKAVGKSEPDLAIEGEYPSLESVAMSEPGCEVEVWVRLRDAYDLCVHNMKRFRNSHMNLVAAYIIAQQKHGVSANNLEGSAGGKGTGGTELMSFLKPIKDDCARAMLGEDKVADGAPYSVSTSVEVPIKVQMPSSVEDLPSLSPRPVRAPSPGGIGDDTEPTSVRNGVNELDSAGNDVDASVRVTEPERGVYNHLAGNVISYIVPVGTMDPDAPYRKDNAGLDDIDLYRGAAYPDGKMKYCYRLPVVVADNPAWCSSDAAICSIKDL